jgi:peroxiredoxin
LGIGIYLPVFDSNEEIPYDPASWTLPIPARYVIDQDGSIVYAEVNPDYTRRPEPEELLPALRTAACRSAA